MLLFVKVLALPVADLASLGQRLRRQTHMELFNNLLMGLSTALELNNLLFCLIGVVIGTAIGVLPGIGPIPTMALLLPFTFGLSPRQRHDHAGRHLLRRAVWRLDHRHPGQRAGRDVVGRHLHRRPRDGQAGQGRDRARPSPPSPRSLPARSATIADRGRSARRSSMLALKFTAAEYFQSDACSA